MTQGRLLCVHCGRDGHVSATFPRGQQFDRPKSATIRKTRTVAAHHVLDTARSGLDVPENEVSEALRVTGDLQDRLPMTRDQQRAASHTKAGVAKKQAAMTEARKRLHDLTFRPTWPRVTHAEAWGDAEPVITAKTVVTVAPTPPSRYAVTETSTNGFAALGIGRYL